MGRREKSGEDELVDTEKVPRHLHLPELLNGLMYRSEGDGGIHASRGGKLLSELLRRCDHPPANLETPLQIVIDKLGGRIVYHFQSPRVRQHYLDGIYVLRVQQLINLFLNIFNLKFFKLVILDEFPGNFFRVRRRINLLACE